MKCISLPGIKSISYAKCDDLEADLIYQALVDLPITISTTETEISLKSIPTCELEESPDNNIQTQKAKLAFTTLQDLPTNTPLAFLIHTINDTHYILGVHERPFPSVKTTTTTSKPDGEAAVKKYEITFTARKALIPYNL